MNLRDLFAQVLLRPRTPLSIRLDFPHLSLSREEDGWYFGSGVTQARGTGFGFGVRPSRGETDLGTILEGSVEYIINRWWSMNGYAGWMRAGNVVRRGFQSDALTFAYLENIIQF